MQFSLYRVWLLSKKQWAENRQLYLLGLLATAGIMALAFLFHSSEKNGLDYNAQEAVLLAGLAIGCAIFTSTILSQFNGKSKGIHALTLPASAAEKLVTAIIYSLIIYPVAYLIVTYPVLFIMHFVDSELLGHANVLYNLNLSHNMSNAIIMLLVLQTAVLMFSVLFKRYTIIKTTVLIMVVFFGTIAINSIMAKKILNIEGMRLKNVNVRQVLYNEAGDKLKDTVVHQNIIAPQMNDAGPYSDISMYMDARAYVYSFDMEDPFRVTILLAQTDTVKLIFKVLLFLWIPLFWLISWFRLREIQL